MASDRTNVNRISNCQDVLESVMAHLVFSDEATYPWLPESSESEPFFERLEEAWDVGQTPDELAFINEKSHRFFTTLAQSWDAYDAETADSMQHHLVENFGDRVPLSILAGIAQKARDLFQDQLPLANQLVQCVQDSLSGWESDDLLVMARPYAFAMRDSEMDIREVALRSVRCAAWTELSGVEQARLSLAIARYTLSQLSSKPSRS